MIDLPILNCDNCGACCTGQAALPVHLVGEHFRMEPVSPLPPGLAEELRNTVAKFNRDGWPPDGTACIWYDPRRKRCRHYEHRPTLCRDEVVPGDEGCRRWREAVGVDRSKA